MSKTVCKVCGGKNYAGGLCHVHHRKAVNAGEVVLLKRPNVSATKGMSLEERLRFYGLPDPETGCVNWQGSTFRTGYGKLTVDKKTWLAHRLAYECFVGAIPEGLDVLHRCDNRRCCNTEHLFLGVHAENMHDRNVKDRQASVLTREQVIAILADTRPHAVVAEAFGTSYENVLAIRHGRKWKHVPRPAVAYARAKARPQEGNRRAPANEDGRRLTPTPPSSRAPDYRGPALNCPTTSTRAIQPPED